MRSDIKSTYHFVKEHKEPLNIIIDKSRSDT